MNHSWLKNIDTQLIEYLNNLNRHKNSFEYSPVKRGLTKSGEKISLGFSCYVIKILFTLNEWDKIDKIKKNDWVNYIHSFQQTRDPFPINSYIDNEIYNFYKNPSIKNTLKDKTKKTLNIVANKEYKLNDVLFQEAIRADSKQAISTLFQIGEKNKLPYKDFPKVEKELSNFLNSLNWKKPWSAGGQLAATSLFTKTQLDKKDSKRQILLLSEFIKSLSHEDTGLYYLGKLPNKTESINGAMKVITALDWLDEEIHYPKKLINFCLSTKPSSFGCDLVDIVYVLYKCLIEVEYKRKEIISYLDDIIGLIYLHYKEEEGGFSYAIEKSQDSYYGLTISNGLNQADLHGTILLTWALSMIFNVNEDTKFNWKIIKP